MTNTANPDPFHKPVLDRVDMNVVDVTGKIVFVANGVLPVAPLPDTAFTFSSTAPRNRLVGRRAARERRLDESPAGGKFCGALGKVPD